ncbi:ThiF family adenylyltransferase [Nonomuraea sp. NPDC059194]|uniref:ThiF family adenylyltransferase n=1 Tax=Nonomuraea sp. NPDC059194 TaxID=3346764 RepID=UPI0036816F0B
MRPRVKPVLRRILRDEHTLQFGVHPRRAVLVSDLAPSVKQWIDRLDGTREIGQVMREASKAGLSEEGARSLLDTLTARGVLDDAAVRPVPLSRLTLAERDRLRPDLDALDLASTTPGGALATMRRRREARVRVYGAGRVGAQIVALLAASGVGQVRVIDPGLARAEDLVPGGLGWGEVGLPREEGAAAVARRITAGAPSTSGPAFVPPASGPPTSVPPTSGPPTSGPPTFVPSAAGSTASGPRASRPRASGPPAPELRAPGPRAPRPHASEPRVSGPHAEPRTPEPRTAKPRASGPRSAELRASGSSEAGCSEFGSSEAGCSVDARAGGPPLGDGSQRPDLVILAPVGPLDAVLVSELVAMKIPHLLASAFEGHGSVGPLVRPGETACLHCLDLARRDRDPAWPIVTARLGGFPAGEIACSSVLSSLVAAAAAGHALAHIDGQESAVTNGTMDVLPDWRWKRRSWTVHPQCRCWRNDLGALTMVTPDSCG